MYQEDTEQTMPDAKSSTAALASTHVRRTFALLGLVLMLACTSIFDIELVRGFGVPFGPVFLLLFIAIQVYAIWLYITHVASAGYDPDPQVIATSIGLEGAFLLLAITTSAISITGAYVLSLIKA